MSTEINVEKLEQFANDIRIETVRTLGKLGFGHLGGAMSVAELLSVLYSGVMRIDPRNPGWLDRDWLVCSKGHAGPAIYATLAMKGYFPMEELATLNQPGTNLPSHCDRNKTPGIDMTTGPLGQGASLAAGIALGNRLNGRDSYTYLILGDGEIQEGQVWEAVLFAAQRKLDNLIAFVDYNKQQLDGFINDICSLGDIAGKFKAFGWSAQTVGGSDVQAIYKAIAYAKNIRGLPSVVVLDTVKGKGCSFVEGKPSNHHVTISTEQMEQALLELSGNCKRIYKEGSRFDIGRGIVLKEGADASVFATGIMVDEALKAAEALEAEGISVKVVNIFTLKPVDTDIIIQSAAETGAIVTAENHSIINGLGSAVAEVLAENIPVPLERVGVKDLFGEVGPVDYLAGRFELTAKDIEAKVRKAIARKK